MAIRTEVIPCNFVGEFKVGDNLVYNADLLCKLTETNANGQFNKPIVIQVGSIVEAALEQIIFRARNYNVEGVPGVSEADRKEIEEKKKVDKFNTIIDVLKKYKVLDGLGTDIYDELHKLRKYRNKVHIQESIDLVGVSRDESAAFTDDIRKWALNLNVKVLNFLNQKLARPAELHKYVGGLSVPIE
jgi:hypothetical protein